jgi:eukaryotic-like serine/threonine-protein kinase
VSLKRTIAILFIVILCLSMFSEFAPRLIAQQSSSDWPMFHANPSHSGVGFGNPVLTPTLLWNYTTGFSVDSSPAVVNGVVYIGSGDGNVYALDAKSGVKLWNYTTGTTPVLQIGGRLPAKTGGDNGVGTSPAVVDGVVYVGALDHNVYALNAANGNKLWNYTTGARLASGPTVVNGVVYIGSEDCNFYALDATKGAKLWNFSTYGYPVSSSPAVVNGAVYVGSNDGNVYALNAVTGAKLWSYLAERFIGFGSPAVVDSVVYVGSGDSNVYALNAVNGAKLWNYTTGFNVESSPAVANGIVYIGSDDGNLYALNASNGNKIWTYTTTSSYYLSGNAVHSSPIIVDGVVYVGSDGGSVYALNAGNGSKIWSYLTPIVTVSKVTITSSISYTGNQISASPAFANGIVYVASSNGNVYAFGTSQTSPSTLIIIIGVVVVVVVAAVVFLLFQKKMKTKAASPLPALQNSN